MAIMPKYNKDDNTDNTRGVDGPSSLPEREQKTARREEQERERSREAKRTPDLEGAEKRLNDSGVDSEKIPEGSKLAQQRDAQQAREDAVRQGSVFDPDKHAKVGKNQLSDLEAGEKLREERRRQYGSTSAPLLAQSSHRAAVSGSAPGRFAPSVTDDNATRAKKFIARNIPLIVAGIVFLVTCSVATSVSSSRSATIERQQSDILALQNTLDQQNKQSQRKFSEVVDNATGGLDLEHKAKDDQVMRDIMGKAMTWDGLGQYLENRKSLIDVYGLDENSQFMRVFMPGEPEGVARKAPSGKIYYAFDNQMKSNLDTLNTWVTKIDGDIYSYAGVAKMATESKDGSTSGQTYAFITYRMVDGKPVDLVANAGSGGSSASG